MATPSSQQFNPSALVMPVDLINAAIRGDRNVLITRLGLQVIEEQQTEIEVIHSENSALPTQVITEASLPTSQQVVADQQVIIGRATHYGDTLLHLLVVNTELNDLALKVFEKKRCLLNACNMKLETPLHCAAKVGNLQIIEAYIQLAREDVKCVLRQMNNNGDTALHVAAKHGHKDITYVLMNLDSDVVYMVNREGLAPLYTAIVGGYTSMVETMLQKYPSLACQQYLNEMYPVHVATRAGNIDLVKHFLKKYPNDAKLLDHLGQNLFHIAAEENNEEVFMIRSCHIAAEENNEAVFMIRSLINAKDYKGNTPLHIAAIKGCMSVMRAICKILTIKDQKVQNNQGLTPFDLSRNQIEKNATKELQDKINWYVKNNGRYFTRKWFNCVMQPCRNKWERTQVVGLGAVLITTIAFASAFAIPGGYKDNGTPTLGKKYMFKAFILANTQSFLHAFTSLFTLVSSALVDPDAVDIHYATCKFTAAAGCMVVAFGLGSYVILAPVSLPLAIIVLVYTLWLGSPFMHEVIGYKKLFFHNGLEGLYHWQDLLIHWWKGVKGPSSSNVNDNENVIHGFGLYKWVVWPIMIVSLLGIFLPALLH